MSFNIVILCGAVVGALFLLLPVKELKNSYFPIAVTALCTLVTAYALKGAIPLFNYLSSFAEGELSLYFKVLTKVLGITLVCNITADLADEMGISSLSAKVQFAGKIAIVIAAVPVFDKLLSEIEGLI